jgi:hypothetical protein
MRYDAMDDFVRRNSPDDSSSLVHERVDLQAVGRKYDQSSAQLLGIKLAQGMSC